MANEMTREQILASIVPKSDQLTADDLLAGPMTVTIAGVSAGTAEQPVNVRLHGEARVYRPCKTMRRVLVHLWSDDGHAWIGRRMTLVHDPEVKFGGVKVGGIRISHMSDIPAAASIAVTLSKAGGQAKKGVVTIQPMAAVKATSAPRPAPQDSAHEVLTFGDQSWSRTQRGAMGWANTINEAIAYADSAGDRAGALAILAAQRPALEDVADKLPASSPAVAAIIAVLDYGAQIEDAGE